MKKLLSIILLSVLVMILASCDVITDVKDMAMEVIFGEDEHEHTFEYIASEDSHFQQYTCGCPSPEIAEMHYDTDGDDLCDACGYPYHVCVYKYHAGLNNHTKTTTCSKCGYSFEREPHVDADDDSFCDLCSFDLKSYLLKDIAGMEWLSQVDADDIAAIKTIQGYAGVAPGSLDTVRVTTDREAITQILQAYQLIDTRAIPFENALIAGGSTFSIAFQLKDGSTRRIYLNNGIFWSGNDTPYELVSSIPKLTDDMNVEKCYRYNVFYIGVAYAPDELVVHRPIGEINLYTFEFVRYKGESLEGVEPTGIIVKTEFGTLTFVTDSVFVEDGTYYQLACGTIMDAVNTAGVTELISAYSTTHNDNSAPLIGYYGIYKSGAVAGMFADNNAECVWSETVGAFKFSYGDGNRIVILYDGEFYTLGEAYENGSLTKEDIREIYNIYYDQN